MEINRLGMNQNAGLGKTLLFWLGSFLFTAVVLFFYFKVSLGAILLAGILTFFITCGRHFLSKK